MHVQTWEERTARMHGLWTHGVLQFRAQRLSCVLPQIDPACGDVSAPCSTNPPPTVPQQPSPGGEWLRAASRVPARARASFTSSSRLKESRRTPGKVSKGR